MDSSPQCLIIDFGSNSIKAGLSCDSLPSVEIPSIVKTLVYQSPFTIYARRQKTDKENSLDSDCTNNLIKRQTAPIKKGVFTTLDDFERIVHGLFYENFKIDPSKLPTVLPMHPLAHSKEYKRKIIQIMFETFDVPSLALPNQIPFISMAAGSLSGLAVDIGEEMAYSCPVFEGYALQEGHLNFTFSGGIITEQLCSFILQSVPADTNAIYKEDPFYLRGLAQDIKHTCAAVALNFDAELQTFNQGAENKRFYSLPDGKILELKEEQILPAEALIQPGIMKNLNNALGLESIVRETKPKVDVELWKLIFGNTTLSGGTTLLKGFPQRIMNILVSDQTVGSFASLKCLENRKYSIWIGARYLFQSGGLKMHEITKAQYDEEGPAVVKHLF